MSNDGVEDIVSPDGAKVAMQVFRTSSNHAPVMLVVPALGVPASYYQKLGAGLRSAGVHALLIDLRGCGTSSVRASRSVDFSYRTLAEVDLAAALARARELFPASALHVFGHSLGGHVALLHLALVPNAGIASIVLVASGTPYYRELGMSRYGALVLTALVPICGALLGFYPGDRLGFGGRQARTLMQQWTALVRTGRFDLAADGIADAEQRLTRITPSVLGVTLQGDEYAPPAVLRHLFAKLKSARLTHHAYVPAAPQTKVDHIRWLRDPDPVLVPMVDFVHAHSQPAASSGLRELSR